MLKAYIRKLLRREPRIPLMVVGTEFPSYAFCELINQGSKRFRVSFIVNEQPWSHKRFLCGAQLRYPSEIPALLENNGIDLLVCTDSGDYQRYEEELANSTSPKKCQLLLVEGELTLQKLERTLTEALED